MLKQRMKDIIYKLPILRALAMNCKDIATVSEQLEQLRLKLDNAEKLLEEREREFLLKNDNVYQRLKSLYDYNVNFLWRLIDKIEPLENSVTSLICPICASQLDISTLKQYISKCIFNGGDLIRHQCAHCDVIFGPKKIMNLIDEHLSLEYKMLYQYYSEGDTTEFEIRTFESLNPTKDKLYLNYGCGGGWNKSILILRECGYNVYGYEPFAKSGGSDFIFTNLEQMKDMKFDGIFSNNLIEHVKFPRNLFIEIKNMLNNDGLMAHSTPNYDYKYEFTRFHLYFFVGKSVDVLANKTGFNVDKVIRDESNPDYINVVYQLN